jgi:hypothetical protein
MVYWILLGCLLNRLSHNRGGRPGLLKGRLMNCALSHYTGPTFPRTLLDEILGIHDRVLLDEILGIHVEIYFRSLTAASLVRIMLELEKYQRWILQQADTRRSLAKEGDESRESDVHKS